MILLDDMKKKEKGFDIFFIISFILLLPLVISFLNFSSVAFDIDFYAEEFEQYKPDVNNSLNISKDLITYLKQPSAGEEYIISFNQQETSHLKDVKSLIQNLFLVLFSSAILIIFVLGAIYYKNRKSPFALFRKIGLGLLLGGSTTISLLIIFIVLIYNFQSAFVKFHLLFFEGNWQFPADYLLIRLFPEKFFIDVVNLIILKTFITSIIVIIIGILILIIIKKKGKKNKR